MALSAGITLIDRGHYEISATNQCARCALAWPCPPIVKARETDVKRMKANRGARTAA